MGDFTNYCVQVNKLDGSLGSYIWCKATSPEEARKMVHDENFLLPTFWEKMEPPAMWIVKDVDIDKQMSLQLGSENE